MLKKVISASKTIRHYMPITPLINLSPNVMLKLESHTATGAYKQRGAINKITKISNSGPIITCSAGNHALGVCYILTKLGMHGKIFMPEITPQQKINKVAKFGGNNIEIILSGKNFDQCYDTAKKYQHNNNLEFIEPFNDLDIIAGQGTIALEILSQYQQPIDYVFLPIGGGGLASGVASVFKELSPHTKIIGVQPAGAPAMYESIKQGKLIKLPKISTFVDGASLQQCGSLTFEICKKLVDNIVLIEETDVIAKMKEVYNSIHIEPASAMTLCALDHSFDKIENKVVVVIITGCNADISRIL